MSKRKPKEESKPIADRYVGCWSLTNEVSNALESSKFTDCKILAIIASLALKEDFDEDINIDDLDNESKRKLVYRIYLAMQEISDEELATIATLAFGKDVLVAYKPDDVGRTLIVKEAPYE